MGLKSLKAMAREAGLDRERRHDPAAAPADRRPRQGARHHPESAGWGYVGFGLYRLAPGETVAEPTGDTEVILVLVEGKARIGAGDTDFGELGDRMDVFEAHAAARRLRARRLGLVGDRRPPPARWRSAPRRASPAARRR